MSKTIGHLGMRAEHLAQLATGQPVIVTYHSMIVGVVTPLDEPIPYERGSSEDEILAAFLDAQETDKDD